MAAEMRRLAGPIEFLELADAQSATLRVISYERGSTVIKTIRRGVEVDLEIPVLRVHLAPGAKLYPPMYYDISSKTLTAQLLPLLSEPGFEKYEYIITAHGVAPRKRFTLERRPI